MRRTKTTGVSQAIIRFSSKLVLGYSIFSQQFKMEAGGTRYFQTQYFLFLFKITIFKDNLTQKLGMEG